MSIIGPYSLPTSNGMIETVTTTYTLVQDDVHYNILTTFSNYNNKLIIYQVNLILKCGAMQL